MEIQKLPTFSTMASSSIHIRNRRIPFSLPPPASFSFSSLSPPPPPPPSDDETVVTTAVTLLRNHRSRSRWTHLRSLFPDGFTPNQVSQILLQFRNKPHLAFNFFDYTVQHSLCSHSLSSYSTIIHILARNRFKSKAQDLIQTVLHKFPDTHLPNPPKYPKIFESLMATYRTCDSAPFVFDLLIKSCLKAKRMDQAIEIVRMLRSRGIFPLIDTCNSLIKVVCKYKDSYAGYDMYKEICGDVRGENIVGNRNVGGSKIVVPNVVTFDTLMLSFHREGLIENVKEVWDEMERMNCEPSRYSYSVLMAAYCQDGRIVEALRVWEDMGVKNLEYDVVAYNTIIGGFCKTGEIGRAEEFFGEMEFNGVHGTCVTFEHLINGYCKIGDVDSALLLYKDMCRRGFTPDRLTIDEVTRGLCENSRFSEALDYLRLAVKKYNVIPKGESYTSVIKGLCQEGRMEEGLKLQTEMVGKGYEPNSELYNAFIDGYMKQGNKDQAGNLRKEMVEILELHRSN